MPPFLKPLPCRTLSLNMDFEGAIVPLQTGPVMLLSRSLHFNKSRSNFSCM